MKRIELKMCDVEFIDAPDRLQNQKSVTSSKREKRRHSPADHHQRMDFPASDTLPGGIRQSIIIDRHEHNSSSKLPTMKKELPSYLAAEQCWRQQEILERELLPPITSFSDWESRELFTAQSDRSHRSSSTVLPAIAVATAPVTRRRRAPLTLPPIVGGAGDARKTASLESQKTIEASLTTSKTSSLYTDVSSSSEDKRGPTTKKEAYLMFDQGMNAISSRNWDTVASGLEDVAVVLNGAPTPEAARDLLGRRLPLLMSAITTCVRCFRPKVATAACRAATAVFAIVKDCIKRPLFDQLVVSLLMKTAATNKKLKEEALRALSAMAQYAPNLNVVRALVDICGGHDNGHLRAAAAHTVYIMAEATAPFYIMDDRQVRELLCPLLASLLEDGHPEARYYARQAFDSLRRYDRFYALFRASVAPPQLQRLRKTLHKLLY